MWENQVDYAVRCDLDRSRIDVAESLTEVGGRLHFESTKSHRRRIVPIPRFLRDVLADHLDRHVPGNLGHSSITVTIDRYTHLFPSDVDNLIRRLDAIRTRSLAAQTRPNQRSRGIEFGGR